MPRYAAYRPKSYERPTLPLLLYDLGAASQLLPPASVLPEQFYTPPPSVDSGRGEVALMRAVLEDAVTCFQKQSLKSGRRAQRLFRETEEWFFSDNHHWPFSFLNICGVLGLDPDYIRLGLKRWCQHPPLTPPKTKRRRAESASRSLKIAA
jgi:hypothetical protein